jgi:hypothetical protein
MVETLVKQRDNGLLETEKVSFAEVFTLDGCPLSETFKDWIGKEVIVTVELKNKPALLRKKQCV